VKLINKKSKKLPISYGWIALIVGTIGVLMSIPGQTMGVSVFTDFLIDSLEISRTGISTTYMIGTILSALLLGRAGKFYDRYGSKMTAFIAVSALALILLYLSYIDIIRNVILSTGIAQAGTISFIILTFGFLNLRFFGQGILAMVSRNMVLKWFDKNQGFIMAIMGAFTTIGFSLAPKLFNSLIELYNWNGAWRSMSMFIGLVFGLVVLVFFRDSKSNTVKNTSLPKEKLNITAETSTIKAHRGKTLNQALKTRDFWSYNLAIALFAMFNTAFTFHIVSIFSSVGLERTAAVAIFIPISIIAVIFQITGSLLSDYISLKIVLIFELGGIIVSSVAMIFLSPGVSIVFLITGLGISNGTFVALINLAWIKTFGKEHLGAISGHAMGWTVAGSAVGPFLFSALRDLSGNYDLVSYITIILCVILILFSFIKKGAVRG
jgi:MFS transporter, OFA family, oxalate/formate antiporter